MESTITLALPNGKTKSVTVVALVKEVERLAAACDELGYALVLSATTTHVLSAHVLSATTTTEADRGKRVRLDAVARRSSPEGKSSRQPRRRQRPFDITALRKAMREPDFTPTAYAKKVSVNPSLVYYHLKALRPRTAKKK